MIPPTTAETAVASTAEKPREGGNPPNFIEEIVTADLARGAQRVATRFPPEPNGYLHIGHAKSICLNFGLASLAAQGSCNLRLDDTNPTTENVEYVASIKQAVQWLGFSWGERELYASDYFEKIHAIALELIRAGKAYVDSQTLDQIRAGRGSFYARGTDSPFRNRTVEENLDLFARMRAGEFADGAHVLRAKIDMASPDLNLRDPVLYRIRRAHHYRTGDAWCIYPMYDFAHPISDAIEGITHSICTLEFEDHRPLYDWFIANAGLEARPRQIEFARLNITYTVLSKRKLQELVERKVVHGWDDPRMPTIMGMRRRGYSPEALRGFCQLIGVSKRDSTVDVALLEHAVREDLNKRASRVMGVLRPLKIVIENYPEGESEEFELQNNPEDPTAGTRKVKFSREIYIEHDDFMENPPKKFFRLSPGTEIRLRGACIIRCVGVDKNDKGEITGLRCTWDPNSRGGSTADGRKVRGTSHWVSATYGVRTEVRLYDRLFKEENPTDEKHGADWLALVNPRSLDVLHDAVVEPSLSDAPVGRTFQFERVGYFCVDPDARPGKPVFNQTIGLKDTWARTAGKSES